VVVIVADPVRSAAIDAQFASFNVAIV
jgi:uncharacterized protein with GYD domain